MTQPLSIEALKSGDRSAYRSLIMAYQEPVVNLCYRFSGNREDAEDIAQEVFLEVFRSIGRFREESRLSTWIYRIAVNRSLDFIRKRKRKEKLARLQSLFSRDGEALPISGSGEDNPEKLLEEKEQSRILRKAISDLPDNQKAAVSLYEYEGYSYQETAEILKTTVSAVESLLFRARRNLRKRLIRELNAQERRKISRAKASNILEREKAGEMS